MQRALASRSSLRSWSRPSIRTDRGLVNFEYHGQSCARLFARIRDLDYHTKPLLSGDTRGSGPELEHRKDNNEPPGNTRTVTLGKTVRILQDHLPQLLATPLPQAILSPCITLHLFPSTHPHLPTVTGRLPYIGALWTAPVAWGRMPVLGNVKIEVLSQRMISSSRCHDAPDHCEKLFVKWKTCSSLEHDNKKPPMTGTSVRSEKVELTSPVDRLTVFLRGEAALHAKPFHGLFIFEFDNEGRILKHTIEHVEESRDLDQMPKVVSVTDWLLGRAPWNRRNRSMPELAWCKPSGEVPCKN